MMFSFSLTEIELPMNNISFLVKVKPNSSSTSRIIDWKPNSPLSTCPPAVISQQLGHNFLFGLRFCNKTCSLELIINTVTALCQRPLEWQTSRLAVWFKYSPFSLKTSKISSIIYSFLAFNNC